MVDFNKLREENKKRADKTAAQLVANKSKENETQWSYWDRFQHLIAHHLHELTTWEEEFCYSNIAYISEVKSNKIQQNKTEEPDWNIILSERTRKKLKEIEDTYCGQVCHAMQKAGITEHNR